MLHNKKEITIRTGQWEKYNTWEKNFQQMMVLPKLANTFQWYSSAWEMARAQNPAWSRQEINLEKLKQLQKIRRTMAMIGDIHEHS